MAASCADILVAGLGNRHRGDDVVGLEVARRLRERAPQCVRVVEAGGGGLELMDRWEHPMVTYVVDAAQCGDPPGTIYRFENDSGSRSREIVRCSSHAFGLVETLDLARALGREPRHLVVYAIAGCRFEAGQGLSPEVSAAADTVTQQLLEEINGFDPPRGRLRRNSNASASR